MNTSRITILLFAAARDIAGCSVVELPLFPGATIADLRASLLKQFPRLEPFAPSLLWAVNNEYAAVDKVICGNDAIACFPPVSGG